MHAMLDDPVEDIASSLLEMSDHIKNEGAQDTKEWGVEKGKLNTMIKDN